MAAKALMFQGTGSDVGKSLFVAGLCRLASKKVYVFDRLNLRTCQIMQQ